MTLILCIYSILAIVWAALLWFESLLAIPFLLLILAEFIFAIYFAAKAFKRKGKWRERLTLLMPLAIVVLCVTLLFLPLSYWKLKVDYYFLSGQRLKAIEDILMHTQECGVVKLPHWWLSEDGTADVFNANKDNLIVGFWDARGLLCPSWIVIYTAQDRPPTEKDLHCEWVDVVEKLGPHWYFVHFD